MSYQISPAPNKAQNFWIKCFENNPLSHDLWVILLSIYKCLDQTMNFGRYEATNDYLESGGGRCQKSHNGSNIPGHNPRK